MTTETSTERIARYKREHAARVAKLRQDADARIAHSQQVRQELLASNRLHKQLLREESMERRRQDDRVELAYRRGHREFSKQLGVRLGLSERRQLLDDLAEDGGGTSDDPAVRTLAAWLRAVWRHEGIDVRTCADPRLANGSASRTARYIDIGPLQSIRQCLIAAHETGHLLHPDLADAREIAGEFGKKISVPSELAAWRWLIDRTPVWTEAMHRDMTRFVNSYRSCATADEQAAMDALCSRLTFRTVHVRLWKEQARTA